MRPLLCLLLLALPASAAEPPERPGAVMAVQRRRFQLAHELVVGVGVLPQDAFYKGITAHLSYTHHFNDHLGWQVGRVAYSHNIRTGLRAQLERDFGVQTTDFEQVQLIAGSDLVWSPLYGKTALANRTVLHFGAFLSLGGSALKTDRAWSPGVSAGLGFRLYGAQWFSLRFDNQWHVGLGAGRPVIPTLQLSAAFNFGGGAQT
jgi:outer membrane beta-barrel protein